MRIDLPLAAHASPFDSGISSIQKLFTGTVAKAASLIAIVVGGYTFAHGEPGAKKTLTYMGIERTLFFMVCVSAVGMFNLFNSIMAGVIIFVAVQSLVIG